MGRLLGVDADTAVAVARGDLDGDAAGIDPTGVAALRHGWQTAADAEQQQQGLREAATADAFADLAEDVS